MSKQINIQSCKFFQIELRYHAIISTNYNSSVHVRKTSTVEPLISAHYRETD